MKYKVHITRIAYGGNIVEVEALNEEDAENKADEIAGDLLYSEHTSEYEFEAVLIGKATQ